MWASTCPACSSTLICSLRNLHCQPSPPHPDYVGQHVPRLLINREKAGELTAMKRSLGYTRGFDWDPATNYRCVSALRWC